MKAYLHMALIAVLSGLLVARPFLAKQKETKEQMRARGKALVARATELSALKRSDAKPFRLRAKVKALTPSGQYMDGFYALVWVSRELWRQEVVLGPYMEVKILSEGKVWTWRNAGETAAPVFFLENTLNPLLSGSRTVTEQELRGVDERTEAGRVLMCVKAKGKNHNREICVQSSDGTLARLKYDRPASTLEEFSEYISLGDQKFPSTIRMSQGRELLVETKVNLLEPIDPEKENPKLFHPPSGSRAWHWCENPEPWRIVSTPGPTPIQATGPLPSSGGRTVIYGVLGTDGKLRDLAIVWPGEPTLAAAVFDSFQRMRFKPAICNGQPYETEVMFHQLVR